MKSSLRVMVVEDNHADAVLLKRRLEELPLWRVDTTRCETGDEAILMIHERDPDVVFVDYLLGVESGIEVIRRLREAGSQAMLILLTGIGKEHAAVEARRAGASDTITKAELSVDILDRSLRHVTERKRNEEALRRARDDLEIASGVLHNVGNVLNSVSISGQLIMSELKKSHLSDLLEANKLLLRHRNDLKSFLSDHPKGKRLPELYEVLGIVLERERKSLLEKAEDLDKGMAIIRGAIMTQQKYGRPGGLEERVNLEQVMDDSLNLQRSLLIRNRIRVQRDYLPVPAVTIAKSKLMHVLINLITNAVEAMEQVAPKKRILVVKIRRNGEGGVQLSVADSGMGVEKDDLKKIFNQGFSKKKGGHGFGLHTGLIAMREMGGSLVAASEGPGKGATFTLSFEAMGAEENHATG